MTDFEPRRLIKFGNSSFIVSLPKPWVERNNLKKGDWVYLKEGENNEITLLPKDRHILENETKITIDISNKGIDDVRREINSAYINNFKIITMVGKDLQKKSPEIKEFLQSLTGIEILEQNSKEIVAKDFLNVETIAPKKIMRRVDNIIRSIFEDIRAGIKDTQFRKGLFDEIMEEDQNINKLYLLICKLAKLGMNNREIVKIFDMSYNELSSAQWLAFNLEYLGDDLKRVARFLTKTKLTGKQKEYLENTFDLIEGCFINAMTAYHKEEPLLAREVLGKKEAVLRELDKMCQGGDDILIGNIVERLKMVYFHIHNISKLIIY